MGKTATKKPKAPPTPAAPEVRTSAPATPPKRPRCVGGKIDPRELVVRANYAGLDFDPAANPDDAALVEDVRRNGVLQGILCRPVGVGGRPVEWAGDEDGTAGELVGVDHFEVVAGHRRRAAAIAAGLTSVPFDAHWFADEQVLPIQLSENNQRRTVKPSREAAAFADLAARGWTHDRIARETSKPAGYVRAAIGLAKLPAWALAAVDAGTLPRATAELVARVPGAESRARAAACVLLGLTNPADLQPGYETVAGALGRGVLSDNGEPPLSSRETKDLIRTHYQRQLKGAPFSLKMLYTDPDCEPGHEIAIPSCDECPKRAGNEEEAKAEGVRADTCLDPDCFAVKVEAYKAQTAKDAAAKGVLDADLGVAGFVQTPRGWCDVAQVVWMTELAADFPVGHNQNPKREEKLGKVLGKDCPQKYLAWAQNTKPVYLVKTAEARKALVSLGVLKREEKRKAAPKPDKAQKKPDAPAAPKGPSEYDVKGRAALVAALKCRDMLLANAESLAEVGRGGGPDTDAAFQALSFVARVVVRDWADVGAERLEVLGRYFKLPAGTGFNSEAGKSMTAALIDDMTPAQVVGFLLAAAAHVAVGDPRKGEEQFREDLIAYADTSWDECMAQARRELAGGGDIVAGGESPATPNDDQPATPAPPPASVALVPIGGVEGVPDVILDLLAGEYISPPPLYLHVVLADCDLETGHVELPLRNRLVTFFVKLGAKIKPAELAAKAIADHVKGKEPEPLSGTADYWDRLLEDGKRQPLCPADLNRAAAIDEFRERQRNGTAHRDEWGKWAEFSVVLTEYTDEGRSVFVVYDPSGADHFSFHGRAISGTGYYSHFTPFGPNGRPAESVAEYARAVADKLAAERAAELKKAAKKGKAKAGAK